jgi:hypothetical protein
VSSLAGQNHTDADVERIALEVARGSADWCTTDDFRRAVEPFVEGLGPGPAGGIRARIFHALPRPDRRLFWQLLGEEIDADPNSRPSDAGELA